MVTGSGYAFTGIQQPAVVITVLAVTVNVNQSELKTTQSAYMDVSGDVIAGTDTTIGNISVVAQFDASGDDQGAVAIIGSATAANCT